MHGECSICLDLPMRVSELMDLIGLLTLCLSIHKPCDPCLPTMLSTGDAGESSRSEESTGGFSPGRPSQDRPSQDRSRKGGRRKPKQIPFKTGEEVSCTVYKVNTWGVFCDLPGGFSGLLHVSEMTGVKSESADPESLPSAADYVKEGDDMRLR